MFLRVLRYIIVHFCVKSLLHTSIWSCIEIICTISCQGGVPHLLAKLDWCNKSLGEKLKCWKVCRFCALFLVQFYSSTVHYSQNSACDLFIVKTLKRSKGEIFEQIRSFILIRVVQDDPFSLDYPALFPQKKKSARMCVHRNFDLLYNWNWCLANRALSFASKRIG